ncbi:RNase HII [Chitinophaga skermanii]|uniref:Ribonuclease HII n=1 Tax=Chitinophaga skermanii TaxID=331697 RepID=A0A327Q2U5_9BACT|nr:ribonuclease HII [Chitinophaga skermanii]RAI98738.1 RNase HII [Chitinophaga skermanii]
MLLPYFQDKYVEAGCDEAGRGCLAGPVFAAAVILPRNFSHPLLNDSKQLKEEHRLALRPVIEKEALAFAVASIDNVEIDKINILKASFKAMHEALAQLLIQPELILVDGNRFYPYGTIPHECVVKGDGKYASIAAASILAKTYRDAYMEQLHEAHPQYGWNINKGYPTRLHRDAIRAHGDTPLHRKSFRLLPDQLELDFE